MNYLKCLIYILLTCFLIGSFSACSSSDSHPKNKKAKTTKTKKSSNKGKKAKPIKSNIKWQDLEMAKVTNGKIISEEGKWKSGGASLNILPANKDGFVEFMADGKQNVVVGLSDKNENVSFGTIDYGIQVNNKGHVKVRENGVTKDAKNPIYKKSDRLKIERKGTQITYSRNNKVFYTSKDSSNTDLIVDVSFFSKKGAINATVSSNFELPKKEK